MRAILLSLVPATLVIAVAALIITRQISHREELQAELTARINTLKLELTDTQRDLEQAQRQIEAKNAVLKEIRRQRIVIHRIHATASVECDEQIGLRPWGAPKLDRKNPRIGTIISLLKRDGTSIEFTNPDLEVEYEKREVGSHAFLFTYEPLDPSVFRGKTVEFLQDVDALTVRYVPVLRSLGFCDDTAQLTSFVFFLNDIPVITARDFEPLQGDTASISLADSFHNLAERYLDKLEQGAR